VCPGRLGTQGRAAGGDRPRSANAFATLRLCQRPLCRRLAFDDTPVTFSYRGRETGAWVPCQLPAQEFLPRFLQYILPQGVQRVRCFGRLAPVAQNRWRQVLRGLRVRLGPVRRPIAPPECPRCQPPMQGVVRLPRGPPS